MELQTTSIDKSSHGPRSHALQRIVSAAVLVFLASIGVANAAAPARTIVFVSPLGDELERSLRDALTAQLAGGSAQVVFEHFATTGASLRSQVSEARSLASAHDALGVFWLDAQIDHDWLVYLSEPSGDRVLVRRITVETGGTDAATEAVAVITRQSSEALAAGQTVGMQPVEVPPEAISESPPSPVLRGESSPPLRPNLRPHGLAAQIGYAGDLAMQGVQWQSSLRLGLAYRSQSGPYVGAGFSLYKQTTVNSPGLVFEVTRAPIDVNVGMAFGKGRWIPSFELRGIVDVLHRRDVTAEAPLVRTPDATRAVFLLAPRLALGFAPTPRFEVYLAAGVGIALNGYTFAVNEGDGVRTLLETRGIQPAFELGGAFWP